MTMSLELLHVWFPFCFQSWLHNQAIYRFGKPSINCRNESMYSRPVWTFIYKTNHIFRRLQEESHWCQTNVNIPEQCFPNTYLTTTWTGQAITIVVLTVAAFTLERAWTYFTEVIGPHLQSKHIATPAFLQFLPIEPVGIFKVMTTRSVTVPSSLCASDSLARNFIKSSLDVCRICAWSNLSMLLWNGVASSGKFSSTVWTIFVFLSYSPQLHLGHAFLGFLSAFIDLFDNGF